MASIVDRGDSYQVEYLGSSMMSTLATGLGVLQKPLRTLYFPYRQAGKKQLSQERHLVMSSRGLTMTYKESPNSAPQEVFYQMDSILFWDAVQFVTVRGSDKKKISGAFEPLDNDHSRNKVNLFSVLDKKLHFLVQMQHPPLFTCVLRRTSGVKALDVHAFVCTSDDEALSIVRTLNRAQRHFKSDEKHETGVFDYNPFAEQYQTTAVAKDKLTGDIRMSSYESGQSRSLERPDQKLSSGGRHFHRSTPQLAVLPTGDNKSGLSPYLNKPGVHRLTQADFQPIPKRDRSPESTYASHTNRSWDDSGDSDSIYSTHIGHRSPSPDSETYTGTLRSTRDHPGPPHLSRIHEEPRQGGGHTSDDQHSLSSASSLRERYRETSGEATAGNKLGQGYGLLSPSGGPPLPVGEHKPGRRQYEDRRDTASLPRQYHDSPAAAYRDKQQHHFGLGARNQSELSVSSSSRQAGSQVSNRTPSRGGVYYDCEGHEVSKELNPGTQSPASAVTPNRMPNRPYPGSHQGRAMSFDQLPVSDSRMVIDSRSSTPNAGGPYDHHNRPVAKVPPHKIQGVKVLPSPVANRRGTLELHTSSSSPGIIEPEGKNVSPRRAQSQYFDDHPYRNQYRPTEQRTQGQFEGNWQFKSSGNNKDYISTSNANEDPSDPNMNEKLLMNKKKDAEIAAMMSNLVFDEYTTMSPGAVHGTNLENALGYFP